MGVERRGYHRLAVKGRMDEEELAAALSELDEVRETAERELGAARTRVEALERERDALLESYAKSVRGGGGGRFVGWQTFAT